MKQVPIHLFVYGTLKQGNAPHEQYCRDVAKITPGRVCGRLYLLPEGYPTLDVPEQSILAVGTGNILNDGILEQKMVKRCLEEGFRHFDREGWQDVAGEIIRLASPLEILPSIDAYEDFFSDGESLYQRVLLLVDSAEGQRPAWTYVVAGDSKIRQLSRARPIPQWPIKEYCK